MNSLGQRQKELKIVGNALAHRSQVAGSDEAPERENHGAWCTAPRPAGALYRKPVCSFDSRRAIGTHTFTHTRAPHTLHTRWPGTVEPCGKQNACCMSRAWQTVASLEEVTEGRNLSEMLHCGQARGEEKKERLFLMAVAVQPGRWAWWPVDSHSPGWKSDSLPH